MFNTSNIIVSNNTNKINYNIPEDIKLNIHKQEDSSFFIEVHRDSEQYKKLLCKQPLFIERVFEKYTESYINSGTHFDKIKRQADGGYFYNKKTPCTVLNIQYIGQNKFLFEIKLID